MLYDNPAGTNYLPNCNTVAFIAGAASGIGVAVARQLVLDGVANLALLNLSLPCLCSAERTLSALSGNITILLLPSHVSSEAEAEAEAEVNNATMSCKIQKFRAIDTWFNAAGIKGEGAGTADAESEEMDRGLGVNLKGLWFCEHAGLRQLLSQKERDVWYADYIFFLLRFLFWFLTFAY